MDQDVYYFYANLSANIDARRILLDDSLANWQAVRAMLLTLSCLANEVLKDCQTIRAELCTTSEYIQSQSLFTTACPLAEPHEVLVRAPGL